MITTLVLSGASTNGVMYVGGYKCLHDRGLTRSIRNIIGSSCGAIIGFLIALGLTPEEMTRAMINVFSVYGIPNVSITKLLRAWSTGGILDGRWKREYLRVMVKSVLKLNDVNFREFAKLTGKNLVVVGSNVTNCVPEYFSLETTPNMSLIEAIDISTCIPLVFKPVHYRGCVYVDGGVYNYLPTNMSEDGPDGTFVMHCPLLNNNAACGPPRNIVMLMRWIVYSLVYMKFAENAERFPNTVKMIFPGPLQIPVLETLAFLHRIVRVPAATIHAMIDMGYRLTAEFLAGEEKLARDAAR